MKKHWIRNRKARWGGISALLTILVVTVAVLANAVLGELTERYLLYGDMRPDTPFDVSESCYAMVEAVLADAKAESGQAAEIEIIFCDLESALAETQESYDVWTTAKALEARFDEITVHCYDILTDPGKIKGYTESVDLLTGETMETTIYSDSVIVTSGDYHRVYQLIEFFVFEGTETEEPWAYDGEKKLASAILRAVDTDKPIACLTGNHGEVFEDDELLLLLDDAGYTVMYTDLYQDSIPERCELIVCYNPNTDLISDELSAVSEVDILDEFLSKDGNAFLVFLGNGTPSLPNLEAYLAGWGVSTRYATATSGAEYRYTVQDTSQSLTADGYTIYGETTGSEAAAKALEGLSRPVVFKNATSLAVASTGYVDQQNGTYQNTKGDRVMYPLYRAGENALSWANGAVVDSSTSLLMTLTEQTLEGGSSHVGVVSSVDFSSERFLQSAVYGNGDLLQRLLGLCGKERTAEGLTIKPFASTEISTVTTSQMLSWTLSLALIPAAVLSVVALAVLIRRRRA